MADDVNLIGSLGDDPGEAIEELPDLGLQIGLTEFEKHRTLDADLDGLIVEQGDVDVVQLHFAYRVATAFEDIQLHQGFERRLTREHGTIDRLFDLDFVDLRYRGRAIAYFDIGLHHFRREQCREQSEHDHHDVGPRYRPVITKTVVVAKPGVVREHVAPARASHGRGHSRRGLTVLRRGFVAAVFHPFHDYISGCGRGRLESPVDRLARGRMPTRIPRANPPAVNNETSHPFETLTPDFILGAIEQQGYITDGRLLALNSYENRVYQVGIEDAEPLIAKFYRPGRWTDAQIGEEHEFCFELAEHEIPVVAPLRNEAGDSLMRVDDFRLSLYPRRGGRTPDIDDLDNLLILGRLLGRIHRLGASRPFEFRPALTVQTFGYDAVAVVATEFIPADLRTSYDSLIADLMRKIETRFDEAGGVRPIRVHGDCHSGNILWRDDTPHFVDFDDARMAPAVQDVWMLLSGDRERQRAQLSEIIEGYNEFHEFDLRELHLVEALRTLRLLHYNAWLAERWDDPAFPRTFTWFNEPRYWEQHILDLREQFAALDEPPLEIFGL